jgi:hypothetical protein
MKYSLNLLPTAYRRQRLARRCVLQWSAVLMAMLSIVFLNRWYKAGEYRMLSQQLEAQSRAGRPTQTMLREITGMRGQIDQLRSHQAIAQELEQQRQALALLAAVSEAAQKTGGRLRLTECRVVDLQAVSAATSAQDEVQPAGTVTLIGQALDGPSVAEFHDGLLRTGLFADVKLIKSNERVEGGTALYEYEVRCEL